MNHDDIGKGAAHLQQVSALAKRLQSRGIAIYEHHWELPNSCAWTLVAGWAHRWFEFSWDAREFTISVAESWRREDQAEQHWSAPRIERLSGDTLTAPFLYIESFFHARPDT